MANKITVNVVVGMDGKITLAVADRAIPFEQAKAAIEQATKSLIDQGVDFSEIGEVEQHRHDDPEKAHVEQHVEQH